MQEYLTVETESVDEFEEKRSRFICYVKPVKTKEEAADFIASIKQKHWDAKHNVSAYVLRDGDIKRYSDDGEPQGTAGMPVLDVIVKQGVTDVCVVVTRYFGGILLGAGGLVRAYSHGASLALLAGNVIKMITFEDFSLSLDYNMYGRVPAMIASHGGKVIDSDFADVINITYSVPEDEVAALNAEMTEFSAGKLTPKSNGIHFAKE